MTDKDFSPSVPLVHLPPPDWDHLFYPQRDYKYFRKQMASPLSGDFFNPTLAAWMADAAMLAYGRSGADVIPSVSFAAYFKAAGLDLRTFGDWGEDAKGTQAFFGFNQEFAVLSFRGTEKKDPADIVADLNVRPVPLDDGDTASSVSGYVSSCALPAPPQESQSSDNHVTVHSGFQFALKTVWSEVYQELLEYRSRFRQSPIFFTGHSLGAALATLAITKFDGRNSVLITFGSPRVGNKAFCEQVQTAADAGIYRFVNHRDLVTAIPPKDHFYDHTRGMMCIDQEGGVHAVSDTESDCIPLTLEAALQVVAEAAAAYAVGANPPSALVDHSPSRYCYFLWRMAQNA